MASELDDLLRSPSTIEYPQLNRTPSVYQPLRTFQLAKGDERHYQHQYADMYFLRLAKLKPVVEQIAEEAWEGFEIAGEQARRVDRVLDVRQGQLCWVVGTVYMEMPLKPNILDDIAKEHWIAAPPPRDKYLSPNGGDKVMLEDESGRLRLTGTFLESQLLVTGCIVAVIGTENAEGDFEVLDLKVADLPRQPARWEAHDSANVLSGGGVKQTKPTGGKIALVSGLGMSGEAGDTLMLDLLAEYLLGEAGGTTMQRDAAQISRLIIAGNSLAHASPIPSQEDAAAKRGARKYGYDASAYNPSPTDQLDAFLAMLLPSIPVTLIPGDSDPANVAIPQQPIHPALFPHSRAYAVMGEDPKAEPSWFDSVTNPWEGDIDGWRVLGTGGQPVEDLFRYIAGDDRLEVMEHILRWRYGAPTAPDTLWCYPFQTDDPLLISECPHLYFAGNQPRFETTVIEGSAGQSVRLLAIPRFKESGMLVLLDTESLGVECVQFEICSKD